LLETLGFGSPPLTVPSSPHRRLHRLNRRPALALLQRAAADTTSASPPSNAVRRDPEGQTTRVHADKESLRSISRRIARRHIVLEREDSVDVVLRAPLAITMEANPWSDPADASGWTGHALSRNALVRPSDDEPDVHTMLTPLLCTQSPAPPPQVPYRSTCRASSCKRFFSCSTRWSGRRPRRIIPS